MLPFEVFEHTADIALKAYGTTLKEAFENAARGMFGLMVEPARVESREKVTVQVEADDREGLLVAWLNELIYIFDAGNILFKDFKIEEWDQKSFLKAFAYGERVDLKKHQFEIEVKACTYHKLKVTRDRIWTCRVIFDV